MFCGYSGSNQIRSKAAAASLALRNRGYSYEICIRARAPYSARMQTMNITIRTPSEQVFNLIRNQIISGSMAPGSVIIPSHLCDMYGISRGLLKLMCLRLEKDGLVTSRQRILYVSSLLNHEIEDVLALRFNLEPAAAARAATRATANDKSVVSKSFHSLEKTQKSGGEDFLFLHRHFNLSLICGHNTPVTQVFTERLQVLSDRYVATRLDPELEAITVSKARLKMLAWTSGDIREVSKLIRDEISFLRRLLIGRFGA